MSFQFLWSNLLVSKNKTRLMYVVSTKPYTDSSKTCELDMILHFSFTLVVESKLIYLSMSMTSSSQVPPPSSFNVLLWFLVAFTNKVHS
ncbi:hypothetical protein CR513_15614, partial [Mucuna pruriens]